MSLRGSLARFKQGVDALATRDEGGCVIRLARAPILAVSVAVLACGLGAPPAVGSSSVTPFHEVKVLYDPFWGLGGFATDGIRFALIYEHGKSTPPLVVDTFGGRKFRPEPPSSDCEFRGSGAALLVWSCPGSRGWRPMISELATGTAREPAGWDAVVAMESEYYRCHPGPIGRRWLTVWCNAGLGPTTELYLNHRTGTVHQEIYPTARTVKWFPNLDLPDLGTRVCPSLRRATLGAYQPPFALQFSFTRDTPRAVDELRLRRCGGSSAELLSGCPDEPCVTPQLGGRYVTWGEGDRVFAYLPRIRRRVLVGRAPPALNGLAELLGVAHTCDRVYAQWSNTLYVARFQPRRGTPPCQTARSGATQD
jgi:hypothetical protein